MKINNPFIVTGEIPDKYFCDREKESKWLISSVTNGNNIVLISPRRMGKTSLVEHCYNLPPIKDNYYTFYIDILTTTSLAEMVYLLGRKIYDVLLPYGKKIINGFISALTSLRGCLGYDALSGMPVFTISSGSVPDPEITLEEIFHYLSHADKPCIVTIDEFQQIGLYPEKNVEALLRSHIQKIRNCNFIFSGSERHMMTQMFLESSRPFYNSATLIDLRAIPIDVYSGFIIRNFADFDRTISPELAEYIYRTLDGNTFYIQRLCNACFANTEVGAACDMGVIEASLRDLLDINETFFRERLSLVSSKQKPLLYVIAKAGSCGSILSAKFIKGNHLESASAVQHAARQLVESGLIMQCDGEYSLSDKLLAIWIRRNIT